MQLVGVEVGRSGGLIDPLFESKAVSIDTISRENRFPT